MGVHHHQPGRPPCRRGPGWNPELALGHHRPTCRQWGEALTTTRCCQTCSSTAGSRRLARSSAGRRSRHRRRARPSTPSRCRPWTPWPPPGTLETEVGKSQAYLERVQQHDDRVASGSLDLDRGPGLGAEKPLGGIVSTCRVDSSAASSVAARTTSRATGCRARTADQRGPARLPHRVESMVADGACARPVASRVRRVRPWSATPSPGSQPRCRELPGLLGDGDRDRLPARGRRRLPPPAPTVRRQPPGRPWQVLLMLLIDQLDLLASTMDKASTPLSGDADALFAHGRFLPRSSASLHGGRSTWVRRRCRRCPRPRGSPGTGEDAGLARAAAGLRLRPLGHDRDDRAPGEPAAPPPPCSPCPTRWTVLADWPPVPTTPPRPARRRWRSGRRSAESAPRAAADWGAAAGTGSSTQDFFDAASRGRRWRGHPRRPSACSRPSGPRTPRPMRRRWPRSPPPPASSASRRCASSATPPSPPPRSCPRSSPTPPTGHRSPTGWRPLRQRRLDTWRDRGAGSTAARPEPGRGAPVAAAPAATARRQRRHHGVSRSCWPSLDALIGLQRVKREIHRQVALLQVEKLRVDAGLKPPR